MKRAWKKRKGQAFTEFILIAAFVGLVLAVAATDLFDGIKRNYYHGVLPLSRGADVPPPPAGDPSTTTSQQKPVAKISGPTKVHLGETVTFTDQSYDVDGKIVATSWGTKTITRTFAEEGEHLITLTVVDDAGLKDTIDFIVTVGNDAPNPIITVTPDRVLNPGEGFSVSGAKSFDDQGDEIQEWEWYMTGPDGKRERKNWPLTGHTFAKDELPYGKYTFELRVMDQYQKWSDFISKTVEYNHPPTKPQINAKLITRNFSYSEIQFQAYGSEDPDGDPITYEWQGVSPDNRYTNGTHTVKVRAKDSRGGYSEWVEFTFSAESPMKTIFEKWQNYQINSASGDWKYDAKKDIIHTTQNVGWTGFWNPEDVSLKDYRISWEQGVIDQNQYGWIDNDTIGMTFRMKDSKNFYFVAFDNGGDISGGIYKMVNGSYTKLLSIPHKWKDNTWDKLEVEVIGNKITVKLNGTTYTVTDNTFSSGGYGPFTRSQAYGTFKNLRLDIIN